MPDPSPASADARKTKAQLLDELSRLRDQKRALMDGEADAIILTDLELRITEWSRGAERLYGWPAAEALGRPFGELIPTDLPGETGDEARDSLLERGGWRGEAVQTTRDGARIEVLSSVSLIRDETGEPTGAIAINRDVTGRRRAEADLAKSAHILEATSDIVITTDTQGRVTSWNRGAERAYGYERDEVLGRDIGFLYPQENLSQLGDLIGRLMAGEELGEIETTSLDKAGAPHRALMSLTPLRDGSGEIRELLGIAKDITGRRRAEADLLDARNSLRAEKALTDAALDAQTDTFYLFEPESGRPLRWNRALAEITGYTDAEIAKLPSPTAYYDEVDQARAAAFIPRVFEEGVGTIELDLICKDGRRVPTEYRVAVVETDAGQPARLISIGRDVSERRRAEAALRESERRLGTLLGNLPGAAYRCRDDEHWTMEFISDGIEQFTGYPAAALILNRDHAYADLIHPDDRAMVADVVHAATARGDHFQLEYRLLDRAGAVRWVWEHGVVASRAGDGPAILEGYITDITERHRTLNELRESEEKYRALIESSDLLVSLYDRDGTMLLANRRVGDVFGLDPRELVGRNIREIQPVMGEEYVRRLREVIDSGRPHTYEEVVPFPDGERYLLTQVQPVLDAEGRAVSAQVVGQDVTDIRDLEKQLQQSQKMEAIGRLAGGVAHDFNNVLTVINNYGNLILDTLSEHDPLAHDIGEIMHAASRATDLTRQLLAFGRKQIIQPRVIDVNATVARTQSILRRLIGEDVELEFRPGDALSRVRFDPGQLDQILFNLAVNARDAMPGGGRLTLETRDVELDDAYSRQHSYTPPGRYVVLAVSDTGVGMDADTRRNIFEPFYTTKDVGEGTGLGLSTVYGIVKQHGGSIEVYSEKGVGTTFRVYLRTTDEPVDADADSREAPAPRGRETILLVEDDAAVRGIAERILVTRGYRVIAADGAGDALLLCERSEAAIDLVLTDVVMPTMSGKECVVKLLDLRPDLKVLYMSGYTEDTIAHHGVLDPDTPFIQKPFTVAELSSKVREVLDAGGALT